MSVALIVALAAATSPCTVENAHYRLRTAPGYTAQFHKFDTGHFSPSGVAFEIHSQDTRQTYWFLPWGGGTDGLQHLRPIDPAKPPKEPDDKGGGPLSDDIDYVALDQAYRVIDSTPDLGKPAPAHILLPNLGDQMWHQRGKIKERPPKQLFDLVSCAAL